MKIISGFILIGIYYSRYVITLSIYFAGYTYQKENENNTKEIGNLYAQDYTLPELLYPSPITRTTSSRDVVQIDSMKNINNSKEDDIRTVMDGLTIDSENVRHIKNKIS